MRRSIVLIGLLGGVALVVSVVAMPPSAPGAASKAPVKLHGVMRVKGNLVLNKGSRYLVTGTTMIAARGSVVIDAPSRWRPGPG